MEQIKKEHILKAIEEIGRDGIRDGRHSSTYDLLFEGKKYPPKLVISIANRYSTGSELDPSTFSGGPDHQAFKLLDKLGFEIVKKSNTKNYWAFHCNPDHWNSIAELKEFNNGTWKVNKGHKNDIKVGDEFLLWISGSHAGVYSFGTITLEPTIMENDPIRIEKFAKEKSKFTEEALRVSISYDNKLVENPILKEDILNSEWLIEGSIQYNFFDSPQGVSSRDIEEDQFNHLKSMVKGIPIQKQIIEKYKQLITEDSNKEELYKWRLIKDFQEKWDIDAVDFPAMLKNIDFANLMHFNTQSFLNNSNKYSDEAREIFRLLYNEEIDLQERIEQFQNKANELYKIHEPGMKAQPEERALATLLAFRFPEKYTLYKSKFYTKYVKLIKVESAKVNEKYIHYLTLIDDLIDNYISKDEELISLSRNTLKNNNEYYIDQNYKILAQDILFRVLDQSDFLSPKNKPEQKATNTLFDMNLNTILYGPPGTGKTYNTLLRAAEIVENRSIDSYDEAKTIFNKHLGDQVEFITFHQNYSYEDFIQGLRPDTEVDGALTFEKKDGVFKRIADRAFLNLKNSEKPNEIKRPFDEVFNEFVNPLSEGEVEKIKLKMKRSHFFIYDISKSVHFEKASGDRSNTLSIQHLKKMYDAESVLTITSLAPYYQPILDALLELGKQNIETISIERKNYVIIIDEINRANISRVFGELITLIEPDKRSHGAIPLKCTLPSGDEFIVPSNLYIIGTMNTADKSIALLDIALRRRFEFVSMYPLYEIDDVEIYDTPILNKINQQIVKLKGYDFQVGHAYFMGGNDNLVERMNKKVIPLLLEYFMNDEKEVKGILTNAGLELQENSWPIKIK